MSVFSPSANLSTNSQFKALILKLIYRSGFTYSVTVIAMKLLPLQLMRQYDLEI